MANEYTYTDVAISNSITGTTISASSSIEPDVFSPTVLTETYTVTEADVLAAMANNGNLEPSNVAVSCSGDRGTIVVDNSLNTLNVYAPNLISQYYEPFVSISSSNSSSTTSYNIGDVISLNYNIKNLTKTVLSNCTLTSLLGGQSNPFSLNLNEQQTINLSYTVTEDDLYAGSIVDDTTFEGTTFANTTTLLKKTISFNASSLNLKVSLEYSDAETNSRKESCIHDVPVSYNAVVKNNGNAPIYNISFHDTTSGQTESIAKLDVNESRTFIYVTTFAASNEPAAVSGTISAEGKDGRSVNATISSMKYYIDIDAPVMEYKVSVDSASNMYSAIPFTLYQKSGITLDVDWGDGTTSLLTSSNFSSASSAVAAKHLYDSAGTYTISIECNDWSNMYICSYGSNLSSTGTPTTNAYANVGYFRLTLLEITKKLPPLKGTCYYSSRKYVYVDNQLGNPFQNCAKLRSIPADIFSNFTSCTSFKYCFYECNSLQSIPAGLFDNNTAVTSFYNCFQRCNSLQSIPAGLFDNNTAVTDFGDCFQNCTSIQSIPAGLFDNNINATDFYYCFYNCTSIQSIPERLFANNTAATNFNACFSSCKSLQSIPEGLFANNTAATNFRNCFFNCTSIQSIPERLFANNTAATNFEYCFYKTSITSIPEGLFANNTAATTFAACFYECTGISSIPEDLFKYNVNVISFGSCFSSCTNLLSIPDNLFKYNVNVGLNVSRDTCSRVDQFNACFYGCSRISSIPENLFKYNVNAGGFWETFASCYNLNDFTLHIGSQIVEYATSFVSAKSSATRKIYVPSGSTTMTSFNSVASQLGLTIIGE